MTGSCIRANRDFITSFECHLALSSRISEPTSQPGSSRSSCRTRYRRNVVITSESVLAYVRANHILPSVSRASSNEMRGATCLSVNVADASLGVHSRRRNRVELSHDSSTLIIRRPTLSSGNIFNAYCCRSTKHRSLLLCIGTYLAKRYPILSSFLMTFRTRNPVTSS